MLQDVAIDCPYCGERIQLLVDASEGEACLVEDCQVCCRPIELQLRPGDAGVMSVSARTGDEG